MDRICCIIDFDGFNFRKYSSGRTYTNEFLIREIGFVRIDPEFGNFLAKSYRFDLSSFDFKHCKDAWTTIHHQTRHVTGLSFKPEPDEKVYSYEDRYACIRSIYKMCCWPGLDVVAYKSGIFEKNILKELNIPHLDLAVYGCPTYEELVTKKFVFSFMTDCGYHQRISHSAKVVHCPAAEVTAFRDWLSLHGSRAQDSRDLGECGSITESSFVSSPADSCLELH